MSGAIASAAMTGDRRYRLSKSKIQVFQHCPRRLWLQAFKREEGVIDDRTKAVFEIGHAVGALATTLVPGGIMIDAEPDIAAALQRTQELVWKAAPSPLFEPAFEREDVLVRVDILEPVAGGWHLAEVKAVLTPKAYILEDIATQVWVLQGCGIPVVSASIRHLARPYRPDNLGDVRTLFRDTPVLDWIKPIVAARSEVAAAARAVLRGDEPAIRPGAQCTHPFACQFQCYCARR